MLVGADAVRINYGRGELLIARSSNWLLLQPNDIEPSQRGWEVIGIFNPAVVMLGDERIMLARIAERPAEQRLGYTAIPSWSEADEKRVDWVRNEDVRPTDARVITLRKTGDLRLTSVSHFQIFRQSELGKGAWESLAVIRPRGELEEFGIEDPRITKIDETYWITYVAVSRSGAATALMSSTDLVKFERHGIIFPSENKDVVLFPDRIGGDYVALHRPNPNSHFHAPQIWIARSPDLIHWGRHAPILSGTQAWESDRVGSGTPPILVDEGWLTLYHGSASSDVAGTVGRYVAGAMLLDRDDPSRVIARSAEPIMVPTTEYETRGFVPNVVFPTAMLDLGEELQVFYGAADTCVAMLQFPKRAVLNSVFR